MIFANMHNHSTFSDGRYTPEELAAMAKREGYGAIVLTDHDTVRGTYFMQKAARKEGLLSILGCEFSTVGMGTDLHLLGFDFNPDEPEMQRLLWHCSQKQTQRTKLLFQWAVEKENIKGITWEEVEKAFPFNDYFCNEHVFAVLLEKGIRKNTEFNEFNVDFSYRFKERENRILEITGLKYPHVSDAIRIIRKAGGVPVVAHPHKQTQYIEQLIEMGLMGIEVNFPEATEEEKLYLNKIADEKGLYKTGGTDHNGVLGGCLLDGEEYYCDPEINGLKEADFMKLYRRELG